ncbi:efflux RND transporter permease subunit [Pseudoflavonifractor phocaeensis]|uniref:efflux RND transporter permease subunit n=1 Tax=Pseudoflavonifractor phocaeensis TaxID=1870988 RepID=UPI001F31509A|nr:efflux RND transporter permease subunit [Pseudoflavonifractor phocaeensis]MCF2661931.1 efflux RND transporter permease subunit [Pseudoflavonifractor phocaeensis]
MNIAKTCIKHKVATLLATIMVIIFGVMFGTQLQMALMPNMEMPMAVVMTTYVGANPSDIEELVTDPLEAAIMSVSGVDEIQSSSSENVSVIMITYVEDTDTDIAATKLREKFDMVSLPDDASDPIIVNMNMSEMMPTAMITLTGEDLAQLENVAEDIVAPALERIDGVAQVSVNGGLEQQIAVEIDASRAAGYGLSNSYIAQFLAGQNLLYPGGDLQNGNKKLTVSTDAKFQSVDDVANMLITLPTGGTVRLSEVANVAMEQKDPEAIAKSDGISCVMLQVSKQSGANEMEVATQVEKRLKELKEDNPGINYSVPYSAREYISLSVNNAMQNIIQGVILAAIVVFLFLRRGSATLTICISMPVCILAVFVMMNVFDLTLNMMSLGGIAMGVGMIVDNSIVVLENINRFAAEGHDRMSACVDGTKEVTSSVIASTLTTLAVFVPLGLTEGLAGMMFKDFCLTIASLIAASLIISLTLVPLLCYFTLDEEKVRRRQMKREAKKAARKPGTLAARAGALGTKLKNGYLTLLGFFIRHLKIGMLASLALVVVFGLTLANTKMVLIPDMDQGSVSISISMPTGSELEESAAIADRVAAIVEREVPELDEMYYIVTSGGSSMMGGDVTMGVMLVDKEERERSAFEIEDALREAVQDIAGCEITVSASSSMSMGSGNDINLEITGDDYDTLELIANDLTAQIAKLPDAVDVDNSLSEKVPQVKVYLNREAAAQYGLTAASVGAAVRAELTGTEATTVTINNQDYAVMVKGDGSASASLDALKSMPITSGYGGTVPLSAVADVVVEQAPQSISRYNQNRQVTVTGSTVSGDTAAMTQQINAILENYPLPEGYTVETAGSYEDMMESFADLGLALAVALLLVYFVLAVQFESFAMPVIVMLILPVAFTGALFALPLTGRDMSMISLVAIIMLAGTVVNSSIILVEYIKVRRAMGESREEAILHACPLRVRPIMMTTLTTVLAMMPMALGIGGTNEMMSDMGITMISGMIISTLVTLVFTPVFYSVIDNISHMFSRKKNKAQVPAGA